MSNTVYMTREEFDNSIIAYIGGDEPYENSGYIAFTKDNVYYLTGFSHCSCYGTFTAICGGGYSHNDNINYINYFWKGSLIELINLAKNSLDPYLPTRTIESQDFDSQQLLELYRQIIEKYSEYND